MNAHYPFAPPPNTHPKRFEPHANVVNNTISIHNGDNTFEVLTEEQALAEIYEGGLLALTHYAL